MSLIIDLPPEKEQQLREEAARRGQPVQSFARLVLEERLEAEQRERARRIAALMEQWNAEDAADPDLDPILEIEPLRITIAETARRTRELASGQVEDRSHEKVMEAARRALRCD